jgi:replicative DNA helicase
MKTSLNNLIFEYQLEINYNTEENQKLYTDLSKLDFVTNGFSRGSLNIVSARKGNGISSFKNTLLNKLKLKTTIISKSNVNKFLHSLLSYKSGVSKAKISHKVFSDNDFIYVNKSFKEIQNLPIFIKKKKKLTLGFLDSYLKKNEEIDCLLIENLDSFLEKEKILFKGLKELAKKKNVVLICFYELEEVASCNPYLEINPSISDFKNSFSLKKTLNNIDNLIFIFRPEFYNIPNFYKTKEATEGKAVISIYRKEEELKEIIVGFSGRKNIFSDLENYEHLNWVEKLKVLNS